MSTPRKGWTQDMLATIRNVRLSRPAMFQAKQAKEKRKQEDGSEKLVTVTIPPLAVPPTGRELYVLGKKLKSR